ncbi:pollen-specific protein C13-like [Rhododendron vialii]|uniref:pollen-specific protein C13-like n=1 Tax=Rhododendron vialii TaxID=182163 RepID=UPI00265F8757|nr:pollen-specific protein C13-like [Rhododendron vialii]
MARLVVLFALCVLPALASAANPFLVRGRVYCDTCRAGFETEATPGIPGAKVRIECKDRDTLKLKYSIDGVTDSTGTYYIMVTGDHGDNLCDAVLVSSPQSDCSEADPARNRSRVILTRYNGLISDARFANAMGFLRSEPMSGCSQLLQKYQDTDDS